MTAPDGLAVSHRPADIEPQQATTIGGILRAAADSDPDRTALVAGVAAPGRRRRWTYAQLYSAARGTAGALAARFDIGERVAVWAGNEPETLILSYAAAVAGLVLVPLNPALRSAELAPLLRRARVAGLFHAARPGGEPLDPVADAVRAELPDLRFTAPVVAWTADAAAGPAPAGIAEPSPDHVAQVIFTSGTTGAPKGACLTHGGMTNAGRLGAARFGMRPGDIYVDTMPLFHVGGQVVAFQICQQRAAAVLPPAFDPGLVLDLIEAEGATLTAGVPTMLLALIAHPGFDPDRLASLRAVSSGGAVVPPELITRIEAALGVQTAIVFGQTEACGFIAQTSLDDAAADKATTLGRPLPNLEARVVTADGAVVAVGAVGELQVRGPNLMVGYLDQPQETAAVFDADGWLATGDVVTMDRRGYLRMVGRLRDIVVSGGENIYPAEIEAVLTDHPAVAAAAVVGVPDPRWGEALVGFVEAAGDPVDPAELEQWLRARIAGYKVPRRWVAVDGWPRTASGKVQKFVLRDRWLAAGTSSA